MALVRVIAHVASALLSAGADGAAGGAGGHLGFLRTLLLHPHTLVDTFFPCMPEDIQVSPALPLFPFSCWCVGLMQIEYCFDCCSCFSFQYMVGKALGGRWYKCRNGHAYFVDLVCFRVVYFSLSKFWGVIWLQCGRPTVIQQCATCHVDIGGLNHDLLPGQEDVDSYELGYFLLRVSYFVLFCCYFDSLFVVRLVRIVSTWW